jgi:hypothetical protein
MHLRTMQWTISHTHISFCTTTTSISFLLDIDSVRQKSAPVFSILHQKKDSG